MDMYFKDIEKIRWIADQQIERGLLNPGVPIPRIVVSKIFISHMAT